jgi:hypothetical protein
VSEESTGEPPSPAAKEPLAAKGETDDPAGSLQDFLTAVSRRRQSLAAHLQDSQKLEFSDGLLSIYTQPHDQWLATALARGNNRTILEESLASIWGEGATWRLLEGTGSSEVPASETKTTGDDPVLQHPVVQAALDIFGGTARTIESDDSKEM